MNANHLSDTMQPTETALSLPDAWLLTVVFNTGHRVQYISIGSSEAEALKNLQITLADHAEFKPTKTATIVEFAGFLLIGNESDYDLYKEMPFIADLLELQFLEGLV